MRTVEGGIKGVRPFWLPGSYMYHGEGRGPCGAGCNETDIGNLGSSSLGQWRCLSGCGSTLNLADHQYVVTDISVDENWEQGADSFSYTFPDQGKYVVGFTGGDWRSLDYGSGGSWRLQTAVNLGNRSDSGHPNNSPVTASKAIYRAMLGCKFQLQIPVQDSDGDAVRCRWANGTDECASVCHSLPNATLDEETCTLTIPMVSTANNYSDGGWYAVALTVEDFPQTTIEQGGVNKTSVDSLSSIPLQFLITTPDLGNCSDVPSILQCGVDSNETISIAQNETFNGKVYAETKHISAPITSINLVSPAGLLKSAIAPDDLGRAAVKYLNVTWTPSSDQTGENILCCEAVDSARRSSSSKCIALRANDDDECVSNPCQNGGTCNNLYNRFECKCAVGTTGTRCETDINECNSNPCQNGGTCLDKTGHYNCSCPAGFNGTECEIDIDECASNPCENAGTCINTDGHYNCSCSTGFTGDNCEMDINECISNPCQNGGTCVDVSGHYNCSCPTGFHGTNCEIDIDECASNPCENAGTCINTDGHYNCSCPYGFTGDNCESDINECISNPCQNGGTCLDMNEHYNCSCPAGFNGTSCEIDINECISNPCQNGGTCVDISGHFDCSCPAGFNGTNCEIDVNECASNPCENAGNCIDKPGHYNCSCSAGFMGANCETDIDECASNPCENAGTCMNTDGHYNCSCSTGFTGDNCEIDINECISNPCQNGGTCVDKTGYYDCLCPTGFNGTECEAAISNDQGNSQRQHSGIASITDTIPPTLGLLGLLGLLGCIPWFFLIPWMRYHARRKVESLVEDQEEQKTPGTKYMCVMPEKDKTTAKDGVAVMVEEGAFIYV
ncbi:extracellular matrix protein A [Lingula anatina]|uniref:Extracellular matrix protein A n=1 Tax=Lingula anatina TaxID=7574 RepID=A0A1S3I8B5_LINAN|nr:extracellular matrix protein A [Lingula anatina]|eukprot:XP_013394438.1 extracellular matrix protein A [Lingula anatina]